MFFIHLHKFWKMSAFEKQGTWTKPWKMREPNNKGSSNIRICRFVELVNRLTFYSFVYCLSMMFTFTQCRCCINIFSTIFQFFVWVYLQMLPHCFRLLPDNFARNLLRSCFVSRYIYSGHKIIEILGRHYDDAYGENLENSDVSCEDSSI